MRTGKHSLAEPGVKQSSVDETDRFGSSSHLSGSLAIKLLPPSSNRVCVYLLSSFKTVSQQLWTGISQPINLILNTSRLCRQVRVHTQEHTENAQTLLEGIPAAINMPGVVTQQHVPVVFSSATG